MGRPVRWRTYSTCRIIFTAAVVAAVEPRVQLAEIARVKQKRAGNLDAYEQLLRAQELQYEFTRESFAAALHHLERALVVDPAYASAMALAAYCYAERRSRGWADDPDAETKCGMRYALRAIELSKDDANVFWMAAYAVWRLQSDAPRARELVYRSLELNPNSAIALAVAGRIEHSLENGGKSLELLSRAKRLSPRDPSTRNQSWVIRDPPRKKDFSCSQITLLLVRDSLS
jgi:tetratricopeptide (TPR) repeat protein